MHDDVIVDVDAPPHTPSPAQHIAAQLYVYMLQCR